MFDGQGSKSTCDCSAGTNTYGSTVILSDSIVPPVLKCNSLWSSWTPLRLEYESGISPAGYWGGSDLDFGMKKNKKNSEERVGGTLETLRVRVFGDRSFSGKRTVHASCADGPAETRVSDELSEK